MRQTNGAFATRKLIQRWFDGSAGGPEVVPGEIASIYSAKDAAAAPDGHFRLAGSDLEIVASRKGDALRLLVNKGGQLIFRTLLVGAARDTVADHELMRWNMHAFDKPIVIGEPSDDLMHIAQALLAKRQ